MRKNKNVRKDNFFINLFTQKKVKKSPFKGLIYKYIIADFSNYIFGIYTYIMK